MLTSQNNYPSSIGHHRRKWKLPILGVAQIVLHDVFFASIFVAYVEPKLFVSLTRGKILQCSPYQMACFA